MYYYFGVSCILNIGYVFRNVFEIPSEAISTIITYYISL